MMEVLNKFITFPITATGERISLSSIEELNSWLDEEILAWLWMKNVSTKQSQLVEIERGQLRALEKARNRIANFDGKGDPEKLEALKSCETLLTNHFVDSRAVCRLSPSAEFVREVHQRDEILATYIVGSFQKNGPFSNDIIAIKAYLEQRLFTVGLSERLTAESTGFERLRENYRSSLEEMRVKIDEGRDLLDTTTSRITTEMKERKQSLDQFQAEFKIRLDDSLEKSVAELREITETYDKKLSLQASVSYWEKRANSHKNLSRIFAVVTFFAALLIAAFVVVSPIALLSIGRQITITMQGYLPELTWVGSEHDLQHWQIGVLVILLFLSVWLLRLLVRLLLTSIHLATDARERVTMLNTYLALLREGTGLNDKDKQIILESLFRHTLTGLVRDEAIPPSSLSLFNRLR